MLINRTNLADMFRGFHTIYQDAYNQAQSMWQVVATEMPSATSEEHYGWLKTMPRFREWLGDRVINSLGTSDFTIKNKAYEMSFSVDRDHIEDDKIGVYKPIIQTAGQEAKTHPDELVWSLLASGFNSVCHDGQYFFDTDHPVELADGTMGTWSNSGGGGGTAWYIIDDSRPIKPLIFQKRRDYNFVAMTSPEDEAVFLRKEYRYGVDARVNVGFGLPQLAYGSKQTLDATNFNTAQAAMESVKGDKGKVLAVRGRKLVVPPSLRKAGLEVLKAERNAAGATNVMQGAAELVVVPWLA